MKLLISLNDEIKFHPENNLIDIFCSRLQPKNQNVPFLNMKHADTLLEGIKYSYRGSIVASFPKYLFLYKEVNRIFFF